MKLIIILSVLFFSNSLNAATVNIKDCEYNCGMMGCLSCSNYSCVNGKHGDVCYSDRNYKFSISGTSPVCSACPPKNYVGMLSFDMTNGVPCALWRYYGCDDYFVNHVWHKLKTESSGSCWMSGYKSYNILDEFGRDINKCRNDFRSICRRDSSLTPSKDMINEKDFCLPIRNNLTIIDTYNRELEDYKIYYENKYSDFLKDLKDNN